MSDGAVSRALVLEAPRRLVAPVVYQLCRWRPACLAGEYRGCERRGRGDMHGFIPVDREPCVWAGNAEYQYLVPDSMILPVPASLDSRMEPRMLGALGVDATAYRKALDLPACDKYPFEGLPHRCVSLDDAEDLLAPMAGDREGVPPVHGVLTP